jgi:hypothetical protein
VIGSLAVLKAYFRADSRTAGDYMFDVREFSEGQGFSPFEVVVTCYGELDHQQVKYYRYI